MFRVFGFVFVFWGVSKKLRVTQILIVSWHMVEKMLNCLLYI